MNTTNNKLLNRPALFKAKVLEGAWEILRTSDFDGKRIFAATWQRARNNPLWSEVTTSSTALPSQ